MTVAELVAKLSLFDPDMTVITTGFNPCTDDMDTYYIDKVRGVQDGYGNLQVEIS